MQEPKKSLSQNFIKDKNICKKIIKQTNINNRNIIEIGPGYGYLTDVILEEKPTFLYLIEKDYNLFKYLKNKYSDFKNIKLINEDVLKIDFNNFKKVNIISNLPYNISSKIILRLFEYPMIIEEMVLMIQKEMAVKFNYNKKKLNKYKFLNKLSCDYEECFKVPPNVFYPKPKIDSTVVKFKLKKKLADLNKANMFSNLIFRNKRKKINNNLKITDKNLQIIANKRVDEISISQLISIYNSF